MRIAKRDTHIATENLPPRRASTRDTQKSAFSDKISTTTQTPRFYSQPVLIAFADRLDVLSAQDEALHRRRSMSSYRKGRGASLAIVGLKGGMSQGWHWTLRELVTYLTRRPSKRSDKLRRSARAAACMCYDAALRCEAQDRGSRCDSQASRAHRRPFPAARWSPVAWGEP